MIFEPEKTIDAWYDWFIDISQAFFSLALPKEELSIGVQGDLADFLRWNKAAIVQASHIERIVGHLSVRSRQRQASCSVVFCGDRSADLEMIQRQTNQLRSWLTNSPKDPFFVPNAPPYRAEDRLRSWPLVSDLASIVSDIRSITSGLDLVGLFATGPLFSGNATNAGHWFWHDTHRYFFDFSVYATKDKAIKESLSGPEWNKADFERAIAKIKQTIPILYKPEVQLSPNDYRALLAPAAVADLLALASWGGFSTRAHQTNDSPLLDMRTHARRLSPLINLVDRPQNFGVPLLSDYWYQSPPTFELVREGVLTNCYTSPRVAIEFGLTHNCATSGETPRGLTLDSGTLAEANELKALDTGIYVSDIWYLNYSDRPSARITGTTRFASLWIENGKPIGPVNAARLDENLYSIFGDHLLELGQTAHFLEYTGTYGSRGLGGICCPSVLVSKLRVVL